MKELWIYVRAKYRNLARLGKSKVRISIDVRDKLRFLGNWIYTLSVIPDSFALQGTIELRIFYHFFEKKRMLYILTF